VFGGGAGPGGDQQGADFVAAQAGGVGLIIDPGWRTCTAGECSSRYSSTAYRYSLAMVISRLVMVARARPAASRSRAKNSMSARRPANRRSWWRWHRGARRFTCLRGGGQAWCRWLGVTRRCGCRIARQRRWRGRRSARWARRTARPFSSNPRLAGSELLCCAEPATSVAGPGWSRPCQASSSGSLRRARALSSQALARAAVLHRAGDPAQRPAHLGGRAGGRGRRLMRPLSRRRPIPRRRSARAPRSARRARPR
jgi:hypothetical protein